MREAALAVGAAERCGDVTRLVDAKATHASALLRGGEEGLTAARDELAHAIGLCESHKRSASAAAAAAPTGYAPTADATPAFTRRKAEAVARAAFARVLCASAEHGAAVSQAALALRHAAGDEPQLEGSRVVQAGRGRHE